MKKRITFRVLALILAMVMLFSVTCFAAEEPSTDEAPGGSRASTYILATSLGIVSDGHGHLDIPFSITANYTMSTLGAYYIKLYRGTDTSSGTLVKTYHYSDPDSVLTHTNDVYYQNMVSYDYASIGNYYYAVAYFYASDGSGLGTYMHTSTITRA